MPLPEVIETVVAFVKQMKYTLDTEQIDYIS